MNLAAIWKLGVVFVCENNSYAITTPAERVTGGRGHASRARRHSACRALRVDGQDVEEVAGATRSLAAEARAGHPAVLECLTYRFLGHSRSDPPHGLYRTREEVERWQGRDPLGCSRTSAGLDAARMRAPGAREARAEVERGARVRARLSPPDPGGIGEGRLGRCMTWQLF